MTKTLYGDTIVRLRRRAEMGLAAEMQWSLLPPLTFACRSGRGRALEPAYEVAGDTFDYAVDPGWARVAYSTAWAMGCAAPSRQCRGGGVPQRATRRTIVARHL